MKSEPKTPLQLRAENMIRDDELFTATAPPAPEDPENIPPEVEEEEPERKDNESLLSYLQRHSRLQIRRCLGVAMKKLDGQVLASYNKMLEKEEAPVAPPMPKQSIFSPAKAKLVQTPIKKATPYKTPTKTEIENQKSASRKAYRSASKEGAIVKQLLSGDKRDVLTSQMATVETYPESKEVSEEVKRLTGVINEKQRLITGVTRKLGEFIGTFRGVRRELDQVKEDIDDPLASLESPIIKMQNDAEMWHKNLLSDEGTGINVYEVLKHLNELVYKDRQDTIDYYQNLLARRLTSERETYEGAMNMLKRKIDELEYQNKMLEENYKSSAQGEKQELLEKLALAEVRANDALGQLSIKDDEIVTLKTEIDSLRERVQEAYAEKDKLAFEMDQKVQEAKMESESDKYANEGYFKEELDRAQETIQKLEETVRSLEADLDQKMREAQENENALKRQIDASRDRRSSQEGLRRDLEIQKMEYEKLLQEKEQQRQKQKAEWAEIYGNLRQEIEDLKNDITVLNNENDKLLKQLEITDRTYSLNKENEKELASKLKKKEDECSSLWDTLKDMYSKKGEVFDVRHMMEILALRSLDIKAKQRLNLAL